ncbi:MAG TPA: hypothetical protein VFV48_00495, partial [Pseudomonadales bacterium]|nr:hypothetical protein [Pseudomonadales bacterium]
PYIKTAETTPPIISQLKLLIFINTPYRMHNLIYRTITAISIYPHIAKDFFNFTISDIYKASHEQDEK